MSRLIDIITSADEGVRNRALDGACAGLDTAELLAECAALDRFWRDSSNLYQRVRAQLFLATIHRYHLPRTLPPDSTGLIPFDAHVNYLARRFQEAIDRLLAEQQSAGPSLAVCSALALAYRDLAFQTLANQVRRSVRTVRGNQWMFRLGHPADQPLRLRPELLQQHGERGTYPILRETTAVRMDFSHSGWSDIFFLAMDFPEGARVLNASIDLGVRGRDSHPRPPIETFLRVIDRPVLRLVSLDLDAQSEVEHLPEIFDFARDYLGLLKAAVIAAGVVPPGMEGCELPMADLLRHIVGPGLGLEIVSKVNDIPKGSRLAVSTNLLGSLIALCMRATAQVAALSGPLTEGDRRIVAARCILGEWLGGSGGGWQDSGGVWPGIKLICGETADDGDPEFGVSRGRLLPVHHLYSDSAVSPETRDKLQNSLVLVHGGMAQNVGPILEMVTEKYLLRSAAEWQARQEAIRLLDEITAALQRGDIAAVGRATTRNFEGPLQQIIPWCTNLFTNDLIAQSRAKFGADFWGFWMLGGMAGGGMGFLFAPHVQQQARDWLQSAMSETKARLETSLPFAMQPVVYDFRINDRGTWAELLTANQARLPDEYYALMLPGWLRLEPRRMTPLLRAEMELLSGASLGRTSDANLQRRLLGRLLPHAPVQETSRDSLSDLLARNGFDREQHELIRDELRSGRIGLAQNRLPANIRIEDVGDDDVIDARNGLAARHVRLGEQALASGEAAVVSLAAGVGSRWTEGAGVVKALHPFCRFRGRHRRFLDVHLAKSRRTARLAGALPGHVFTTSYLTEGPIRACVSTLGGAHDPGAIFVSPGRAVGLRTIPMVRDLLFAWEEMPQQVLDEQRQKVRASLRSALVEWARNAGEGSDYTDNLPLQCLHPVGHWYEIPNLLRNGTLQALLARQPSLQYLLLHNIDTLGAGLDPGLLGLHIDGGSCLTYEVISRRVDDRGGGLARVDGRVRLVEGLALPHEEDEFHLRYYNSLTTWITVDRLLAVFGLTRSELADTSAVDEAVRRFAQRLPTYVTIKDVKKRWGHGQEDVFPVTQFEKLWGDMTVLPEVDCRFVVVPLFRGQQLKHQAQLDGWLRDGSADYVDALCDW
jgi:hypothetical protein